MVLRDTRLASMGSDIACAGTREVIVNIFQESCDAATPKYSVFLCVYVFLCIVCVCIYVYIVCVYVYLCI